MSSIPTPVAHDPADEARQLPRHTDTFRIAEHERWAAWALIALAFIVYVRVANFGFLLWDDPQTVVDNVRITQPTFSSLVDIWTHDQASLYVPLTYTVWWVLAHITLSPKVFHAVVVGVHAANAAVAFVLARLLLPRTPIILLVVPLAVWTVHPLHVDAVAWVSGLKDVLCMLFVLLSLVCLVRHNTASAARQTVWLITAMAFAAAAMLAKPTGAAIALAGPCVLMAFGLSRGDHRPFQRVIHGLPVLGLYAALALATTVITLKVQPAGTDVTPSLAQRFLLSLDGAGWYVIKSIWPSGLSIDPGRTPTAVAADYGNVVVGVLFLIFTATLMLTRRWGQAGWLLAAAVALWLPVCGLVPFDFQRISNVSSHYAYGPLAMATLAVAAMLQYRPRAGWLAVPLVLAFGVLAWRQVGHYADSQRLFQRALATNPRSWVARNGLATVAYTQGNWIEARHLSDDSLSIQPLQPEARVTLAAALDRLGRPQAAVAVLREKSGQYGSNPAYAEALGTLEARLGNLPEAERWLTSAVRGNPWQITALANLGTLKAEKGDLREASDLLTQVTKAAPNNFLAWKNLGFIRQQLSDTAGARAAFEQALRIEPTDPAVRIAMGQLDPVK